MTVFSTLLFCFLPCILYTVFFTGILCYIAYYLIYVRQVKKWEESNIPYLPPTFLLGHKYFRGNQAPLVPLDRIYRENTDKKLVAFFINTAPIILLRDPKLIQKVYTKCYDKAFLTGFNVPNPDEVEAQNMLASAPNKEVWKFGRSAMAPFFSTTRMNALRFEKVKKQIKKLWNHCEETRLRGEPLNVRQAFLNFAVDEFSHRQFGEETNSYEKKEVVYQLAASFWEPSATRLLGLFMNHYFPALQIFDFLKLVSQKHINAMTDLLKRNMADRDARGTNEDDFIDYLRALRDGSIDIAGAPAEGIGIRQMVGFGMILSVAGTETVATLARFLAHLLTLNPQYQTKIKEEVASAMERHKVNEFTADVVQDLVFTEQCLMETARLYPATNGTLRICSDDFQIPGTKYWLRKGDKVTTNVFSIQRDPKYYEDPDKFYPERFNPERRGSIPPEHFLTFSIGPRKCPGAKVGIYMAAAIIAPLVYKYELRPRSHFCQTETIDFNPKGFILQQKEDLLIDLIPRE